MFKEEVEFINNLISSLSESERNECSIKAHKKACEQLGIECPLHLWDTGFHQGDATDNDILKLALKLKINTNGDIDVITDRVLDVIDNKFLEIYKNELIHFMHQKHNEELNNLEKVKILKITDIEWNPEFHSEQIKIISKNEKFPFYDSLLSDNGGEPDGDMWGIKDVDFKSDEVKKAIKEGAKIVTMYKVRYDSQRFKELLETAAENWIGISVENTAYFLNPEDALLYQILTDAVDCFEDEIEQRE